MKKLLLFSVIMLMFTACGNDDKDDDTGSGWIKYKGKTYQLHHSSYTWENNQESIEGLWLHAAAFTSSDGKANASFSFYCQTPDIEPRTYTYNGTSSVNGSIGELTPASIQIPNEKIMLPVSTIKSGSLTINKKSDKYEFSFSFKTTSDEEITGYFDGNLK